MPRFRYCWIIPSLKFRNNSASSRKGFPFAHSNMASRHPFLDTEPITGTPHSFFA